MATFQSVKSNLTLKMNKTYLIIPSTLFLTVIMLYQAGTAIKKFLEKPTFFSSSLEDQKNVEFPDYTACLGTAQEVNREGPKNLQSLKKRVKHASVQLFSNRLSTTQILFSIFIDVFVFISTVLLRNMNYMVTVLLS